ncbi:MAG: hypothetical protein IAA97_02510 [Spirochaetes bacterium]|uniref:Lipoprotein n=1 Tax=Candidatus Ornithospirochaeta stercoripullorum TaxID=2840899 RepID=A0A9D9DZS3_9SPIO|nr:hypothetical protein [Candidatus Ornithospirochaeta stercoripullorum]
MKRILAIAIAMLLLFASCATSFSGASFSDSEKRNALFTLSRDMIALTELDGAIGEEAFLDDLPPSYTAYEDYSPLYQSLSQSYASSLSAIISPIMAEAFDIISSSVPALTLNPDDTVINSAEGMTDRIQNSLAVDIYSYFIGRIGEESEALDEAFSESYSIFSSLRDCYLNLGTVGVAITLPIPESISIETLAFIAEDVLFSRLEENERELRSKIPESDDSVYQVFWEETI